MNNKKEETTRDIIIGDLRSEVADLKKENVILRKILSHVPSKVAIKAKEDSGFGSVITIAAITEECDHEWEVIDESFDHEMGCEQIIYLQCSVCGKEKKYDTPVFDDDVI